MQGSKIYKLGTEAEAPAEGVKALVGPDEVGKELTATGRVRILSTSSRLGVALAVLAMQEILEQQLRERLRDTDYSVLELRGWTTCSSSA
jgi:hypothetical protein